MILHFDLALQVSTAEGNSAQIKIDVALLLQQIVISLVNVGQGSNDILLVQK